MKKTMLVILLVLLGATGFTATAQAATCDDVVYSATMLASNPNIGDACLEVVEEEEVTVVKLHARVVRQSVNSTIVQWQLPDGSWTNPDRTYPPYGATARIGGKEVRISDLAPKQEVNVYIVSEGNFTIVESEAPAAPAPVCPSRWRRLVGPSWRKCRWSSWTSNAAALPPACPRTWNSRI